MQKKLLIREWLIFSLFIGFLVSFIFISILSKPSITIKNNLLNYQPKIKNEMKIQIEFCGEVKSPGIYYFTPGLNLKNALKNIGLTKEADRKKIDFKKVLYSSERIEIPSKKQSVSSRE